jgi:hypothetical protein
METNPPAAAAAGGWHGLQNRLFPSKPPLSQSLQSVSLIFYTLPICHLPSSAVCYSLPHGFPGALHHARPFLFLIDLNFFG